MRRQLTKICIAACILLSMIGTVQGGAGWEYKGSLGPEEWHKDFPHCGGRMQSPINIDTSKVLYDPDLNSFDLSQYAYHQGRGLTLINKEGHTVEVVYGGEPITIQGGSLPDQYVLDQFHFHWGSINTKGSEHLEDSKAAPMELHLVHHMEMLNKTGSAAEPYGLAVLGFFFEVGTHNSGLDNLLAYFGDIKQEGDSRVIPSFPLADLLPRNVGSSSYYRYYGSLTTPPCYETVIWTLFTEKISISQDQLDTFRQLTIINNDFRPVQPVHERTVISNDRRMLNNVASVVVTDLLQEIDHLKGKCANSASTIAESSMWVSVLVAVLLVLTH